MQRSKQINPATNYGSGVFAFTPTAYNQTKKRLYLHKHSGNAANMGKDANRTRGKGERYNCSAGKRGDFLQSLHANIR